jgi:transposase
LNQAFESFGDHYSTAILPTRAYKPKDKALVEGAVNLVYQRIFSELDPLVFISLDELNKAIVPQLAPLIYLSLGGQFEADGKGSICPIIP